MLKGRALADKFDAASLDTARQDFEQMLVLDLDYADAHALLAHGIAGRDELLYVRRCRKSCK
ncbi:MAG: hypothetical protein ABI304_10165 [Rudaea sp.]